MRLLSKILGGSNETKQSKTLPWITLHTLKQLEYIEEQSSTKPQLIFKHSTRCGISKMVLNQFIESYNFTANNFDLYYLDLLSYRDISHELATKFQVIHQSPQLLVIQNGVVVAHESHGAITTINLTAFL